MQRNEPQFDHRVRAPQRSVAAVPLITALLIALIAFPPRLLGLNDFLTTDEAYHWITRVERFSDAVTQGRWERTLLTGHPGVTNMWLGSIGLMLERTALDAGRIAQPTPVEHLGWLRMPGALLQTILTAAAYLLLRRRIGAPAALAATILWACSPYLIAHSRLLHLDALLSAFVLFSILLLIPPEGEAPVRSIRTLLGSGVFAGLALLTKGPALILLPFAGLLLFVLLLEQTDRHTAGMPRIFVATVGRALGRYAIWLATALLVVAALWPALWAAPDATIERYVSEITANGGRPNGDGQFFLGRALGDPGPLFYLIADLFRATPPMLIGGALALPLLLRNNNAAQRRTMLILAAFALFWTIIMTIGPKKFDRYVLPTWPALLILAGCGLAGGYTWLVQRVRILRRPILGGLLAGILLVAEGSTAALYHPYYLSYYNPLLGGGPAAQRNLLIGWGEGMDLVGAWLRAQPDARGGPVLSALGRTLAPFVDVPVKDVDELGRGDANYAVVYLESLQRGALPEQYAQIRETAPLATIRIHGIEYAWIHQLARPYQIPVDATFGTALHLRGVSVTKEPQQLIVTPSWDVREIPNAEYHVFIHLLDAGGTRITQVDVAPGGGDGTPTDRWEAGRQIAVPLPLSIPADLPSGEYRLVLGMYTVSNLERLEVRGGVSADPQLAGPNAILLTTITIP